MTHLIYLTVIVGLGVTLLVMWRRKRVWKRRALADSPTFWHAWRDAWSNATAAKPGDVRLPPLPPPMHAEWWPERFEDRNSDH